MIADELNGLLKEYDFKKEVMDTKTDKIAEGIRDWCITERKRIDDEYFNIRDFFYKNWNKVIGMFSVKSYCTETEFLWNGLMIVLDKKTNQIKKVCLTTVREYECHLGYIWSRLPKPNISKLDINSDRTDIDYWLDFKKSLAISNEYLGEVAKKCKDLIGTLILNQQKRCDDMVNVVKDIENTKTDTIELKVEIRV